MGETIPSESEAERVCASAYLSSKDPDTDNENGNKKEK